MYVALIAQWKGAKMHLNVSCVGNTDMVLQINDEYYPIDVKLARWNSKDKVWYTPDASKVKLPVYPVLVVPEGDIMDWKIRWKNHNVTKKPHCPPGLEDFWSKPSTQQ